MPKFELVPVHEAVLKTATGKRAQINKEYLGYIERLEEGKAGKLSAAAGESGGAVRRRLGQAARLAGKDLVIKRSGDDVLFWVRVKAKNGRRKRAGRRGKGA